MVWKIIKFNNIPLILTSHHLCSIIWPTVMRLVEFGSSILRSNDKAIVSNLLHGVIVIHELSFFHLTNSLQPVVGSSHGNSVDSINCTIMLIDLKDLVKWTNIRAIVSYEIKCTETFLTPSLALNLISCLFYLIVI